MDTKLAYKKIGFIGLGLIGASLAQLIKRQWENSSCIGLDPDPETAEFCNHYHIIDHCYTKWEEFPTDLDLAFVCTPISKTKATIEKISAHNKQALCISDVASIKGAIEAPKLKAGDTFIPGHPISGSEKSGIQAASSHLLVDAPYILVPQDSPNYAQFKAAMESLPFQIVEMTAEDHDKMMGIASHFPYLMSIISTQVHQNISKKDLDSLPRIIGRGFKDHTRIAESASNWGEDICKTNKAAILTALNDAQKELEKVKKLISNDDFEVLRNYLENNKHYQQDLRKKK